MSAQNEPNWLLNAFERARLRSSQIPVWARPVVRDPQSGWPRAEAAPKTYDRGHQWSMVRHDIGDEPVFLRLDKPTEAEARQWYGSMLESAKRVDPGNQNGTWPELVRARVVWEVVE